MCADRIYIALWLRLSVLSGSGVLRWTCCWKSENTSNRWLCHLASVPVPLPANLQRKQGNFFNFLQIHYHRYPFPIAETRWNLFATEFYTGPLFLKTEGTLFQALECLFLDLKARKRTAVFFFVIMKSWWHWSLGKGFIYVALAEPQEFFKEHLIKKKNRHHVGKYVHSVHFGEVSTSIWAVESN